MAIDQTAKAAQDFVPIKEIRDGIIVLKDGGLRSIIMASSLNFALKSVDEQNAIISHFQDFLNSLDFPVQFFIQSRDINLGPYVTRLENALKEQTNELLQIQMREYIEFIKTLVASAEVVSKSFYVIVPFQPGITKEAAKSGIKKLFSSVVSEATSSPSLSAERFEEYETQLRQRANSVMGGMARFGVRGVPLNTEEVLELFYGLYNPGALEKGAVPQLLQKE